MDQGIFTQVQEEEEARMEEGVWTREALTVGTANWYAKFTSTPFSIAYSYQDHTLSKDSLGMRLVISARWKDENTQRWPLKSLGTRLIEMATQEPGYEANIRCT